MRYVALVSVLLLGAFVLAQSVDPIDRLIAKGDTAAVQKALAADPALATSATPQGMTRIHEAVLFNQDVIAELFLAHGAKLDAIDAAALGKNAELEKLLNADPAAIHMADKGGATPLMWAAMRGHDDTVRLLLNHGAEPDVFSAAAAGLDDRLVQLLAREPKLVNSTGAALSPLRYAVKGGHYSTVELLLRLGADVNAQGPTGTALTDAARRGDRRMVELLLRSGADRSILIPGFGTAATIALANHHPEVAEMLK